MPAAQSPHKTDHSPASGADRVEMLRAMTAGEPRFSIDERELHRDEPRGIGGIFFDDFAELGFDDGFALIRSVGDAFLGAYLPIVERRRALPFGERERDFQAYRRGR